MTATSPTHAAGRPPSSVRGRGLRTVVEGLRHAEGVCWSAAEQVLYAGGEGGEVYRFDLESGSFSISATVAGGSMLGLALDGEGAIYVCDIGNGCVQRISRDGDVATYGDPIAFPNYPVFDEQGGLWVSDSGDWGQPNGAVVRIDPGGATQQVLDGLHFANGLAIKDNWLYVVESTWPRIIRVPMAGGDVDVVVELDEVVPDGLAFDAEGGLWIGCWQPNRVYRLDPDGKLSVEVDDWSGVYAPTPTNLAFAGPALDVLAMASLGTQVVSAFEPGVSGAPLHLPLGLG